MKSFILRCPKCHNSMKYQTATTPKRKSCVYCGNSFDAKANIIKSL